MTPDRKNRWDFRFGRRKSKPPEGTPPTESPIIDLPKGGIHIREMLTKDNRSATYIIVGLTNMGEFDREEFKSRFGENLALDNGSLSRVVQMQKYIVLSQELDGVNTNALFIFPTTVIHRDFYDKLQAEGYRGELQSAGLASKDLELQDSSDTLEERGLTKGKSYAHQHVLNERFRT